MAFLLGAELAKDALGGLARHSIGECAERGDGVVKDASFRGDREFVEEFRGGLVQAGVGRHTRVAVEFMRNSSEVIDLEPVAAVTHVEQLPLMLWRPVSGICG